MGCAASAACATDTAPTANMLFKYVLRFMCLLRQRNESKSRCLFPGHGQLDAVQPGPRRDVQRFAVIAPITIGWCLRRFDRAQMPAIRGEHPYAAGAGAVDISRR